jgi:fatty-acyl-CoA synthase
MLCTKAYINNILKEIDSVKVVLQHRSGSASGDELQKSFGNALVKQIKGSQQSPKTIDYVDGVPLTAVGKPDKKAVRARYWSGTDRSVG